MSNKKNMVPQFNIYKEGVTTKGPITIVSEKGQPYDRAAKMALYKELGYTVTPIIYA